MAFSFTFHHPRRASVTRVEMDTPAKTLEATIRAAKELVRIKTREAKLDVRIAKEGCKADGLNDLCRRTPECGNCLLG